MEWTNEAYLYGKSGNLSTSDKVAAFDLDDTIIRTKSGKTFAENSKDWVFFNENVLKVMKWLRDNNYKIVIIMLYFI